MANERITISNEDQAIDLLKKLIEGYTFKEEIDVEFDSWPRFVISIKGVDYNGTIPTRIMPTLLDLQKEVNRAYCVATYGDDNSKRLTKKDREQLELVVKVDKGSSIFETLLQDPVLKILKDATSRMTPEQLTATLIIFGLSVTSVLFWKMWLANRIKEKELDQQVELSSLEKEKMEIIKEGMQRFPEGRIASENINDVRGNLLTKLKHNDNLEVGTKEPDQPTQSVEINGEQAEHLTHVSREKSVERMIKDNFFLRSADFTRDKIVRVQLERTSDKYSFSADIPIGVLSDKQVEALKNNSWNKQVIEMNILAKELRGKYSSAKVVYVRSNDQEEPPEKRL